VRKEAPAPKVESAPAEARRQESKKRFLDGDRARGVYEELAVPGSSLNQDQMARQLISVLQAVCAGLADAVRGRREFQKEFEVEATRILAWKPNPIKHAENAAEIATILLDPTASGLSDEEAIESLKEVFQDLTLHQLGLMAGFRECIRGLLKELDPEVLGKVQPGESKGKGIGLLSGGSIRSEAAAWRRYMEKHRQLTEEEVKVFERILAPHFTKGYLSVHKTRKRA
jgi:predicted component of type VI protein secretion system